MEIDDRLLKALDVVYGNFSHTFTNKLTSIGSHLELVAAGDSDFNPELIKANLRGMVYSKRQLEICIKDVLLNRTDKLDG